MSADDWHLQDDVVSKPFRITELIPKVEDLAERYGYLPGASSGKS